MVPACHVRISRSARRARASPGLPSRAAHEDTAHLSRFEITRVKVASRMVGVTPQLPPCCIAAGCSPETADNRQSIGQPEQPDSQANDARCNQPPKQPAAESTRPAEAPRQR
ncbi:hypothetical protein K0M31_009508 [Melipona bicolor]|uniref:Uncharacterized protein n=1 Tax=Melipona bicolor TaxID=60889 RepID=A0AA40KJ48_9HYME|nr:hypothetical protein K0M31_009508 [Melipona bicolor]